MTNNIIMLFLVHDANYAGANYVRVISTENFHKFVIFPDIFQSSQFSWSVASL